VFSCVKLRACRSLASVCLPFALHYASRIFPSSRGGNHIACSHIACPWYLRGLNLSSAQRIRERRGIRNEDEVKEARSNRRELRETMALVVVRKGRSDRSPDATSRDYRPEIISDRCKKQTFRRALRPCARGGFSDERRKVISKSHSETRPVIIVSGSFLSTELECRVVGDNAITKGHCRDPPVSSEGKSG